MPLPNFVKAPTLKLRGTIVAAAAIVFTLALGSGLVYVVQSTQQNDIAAADQLMSNVAESQANAIHVVLKEHATAAVAIAETLSTFLADPSVGPQSYKTLFEKQLAQLPNAIGIWALTTKDGPAAANPVLMSSEYGLGDGYFGPSITRSLDDGKVSWSELNLSEANGFKGWFLDPLARDATSLTGPYLYDGRLFTSVTAVIRRADGKGVGLAGVDFNGGMFAKLIGDQKPMGTGWIGVINADGNWVVHSDESMLGMPASDESAKAAIAGARAGNYHAASSMGGEDWRITAEKLALPEFGLDWTVMVAVPESTLLAESIQQRNFLISGGLVLLGLGLVAFWFVGTSIAKPINRLTDSMEAMANGDLSVEVLGGERRDEVGAMARAVEVFRENGLKVAQMTEAEAARIVSDQRARAQMMGQLQAAFGNVVDAAVAGDFSRRVEVQFPDAELNQLAGSVNNLVETVDGGLAETSRVLGSLARADLTERVTGSYSGAFGQLKDDTNAVADKLGEIVGQLRQTSRALKTATGEILSGANDLSERTTKQAATIEETSAAMEQLASTVLQNAERAREASSVAGSVTRTAEEGGQVMNHANEAMEKIETSSSRISNIIGMIDDIAFQTNLLALNASVEAARAGEAGKGFAVVAVEVRRLAQSAAEASSEVKALIEQSAGEVKTGSRLVADAASKLEAMLTAARSSNELMDGIARESREQASAIEEVNVAVRQMDEMTQHNAALVEETNAAIEQTEAQASELDRIVDIFTIDGEARREAPASKLQPGKAIPARPAATGIKGLQQRVATAAKAYLTNGNAAIDKDWEEF
ncbi:methyl-accepting chemotaxis protein [Paradevosia shaoguanensis]|uniref:methyl-accepting chemotaxis protein n=1 Tax=Paradevosia shaoguanensis TaxID=1335043 RepID=UPI001FEB5C7F|nr:methyl-accepting chemotaxis protein [Paradevosia shaoguanensis]